MHCKSSTGLTAPTTRVFGLTLAVLLLGTALPQPAGAQSGPAPSPDPAQTDALLASLPATFETAAAQYKSLLAELKDNPKLPRSFAKGKLVTVPPRDWTSGFFPGSLWLLFERSGGAEWEAAARAQTEKLAAIKDYGGSHDVGFMLNCSYGNGYRLTGDTNYRQVLIEGARTLSTRFKPEVGLIRSWDHSAWKYPVIIDNMMNLELLTWAARAADDPKLRAVAVTHADNTLKNHFRPDASSWHVVDYDPETGAVVKKQTHQGAADDSSWARGQAWALYGYTMMARETGQRAYLAQAVKIAQFIMNHPRLPADKVPYWDFDAPGIPDAPRDASAAAIMASALLELSEQAAALREPCPASLPMLNWAAVCASSPATSCSRFPRRLTGPNPGRTAASCCSTASDTCRKNRR